MRGPAISFVLVTATGLAVAIIWLLVTLPPRVQSVDVTHWSSVPIDPTVRGVFHVHSDRSDGGASVDQIAAAAQRAGLQFVIFTDHGDARRIPDPPRYRSGVLCIDAVEISTSGGHYIAMGLPQAQYPLAGEAHAVVEDVARLGGFGIIAHPTSTKPSLAWTDWDLPFDGVEWLNGDNQWRDETTGTLGVAFARYMFRPSETLASLLDRPDKTLARWDERTRQRSVVALAGSDAHAHLVPGGGGRELFDLEFPGYERVFRVFSIGVALDRALAGASDAVGDAKLLEAGLRSGRVFTVIDAVASPARFAFEGWVGTRRYPMGARIVPPGPVEFRVRAAGPPGARIVLLADGQTVASASEPELTFRANREAAYRVEVHVSKSPGTPPIPWIVSNPIYLGIEQAMPNPGPSLSPVTTHALDLAAWEVEHDAGSLATSNNGPDRVILNFELGHQPSAAAALVYRLETETLEKFRRVVFEVRADQPTRAFVQLRAGGTDIDHRWRRSFYADTTTKTVTIPFYDLIAVRTDLPERADLDRVTGLLVAIESINAVPGRPGRLIVIAPRLTSE